MASLSEYLAKLPGTTFRRLYQEPSTAFALFRRMLPPLAKTIVLRLLYLPGPVPLSDLDLMVKPDAKRIKDQALATLKSLHIVHISPPAKDRPQEVSLTSNFRTSLRSALEGGGDHKSFGTTSPFAAPPENDIAFLDRYARRKREDILHFIVNCVDSSAGPRYDVGGLRGSVRDLLLAGRIVERNPTTGRSLSITQAGFTFLLQEANAQIWTLLILWIEAMSQEGVEGGSLDQVDMLCFLAMLATTELGCPYDTDALTEDRKNMLPGLVDFGLIYVPSHKPQQFFPTRLATTLMTTGPANPPRTIVQGFSAAVAAAQAPGGAGAGSGLGPAFVDHSSRGSIILETNFRVYAYTSSPLQIAVLSLFCQLKMRFPDMVSGRLSRQSVQRALSFGISSEQILDYLAAHAHEQMHRNGMSAGRPVLPPTVVDQIRLWQLESERMKTTTGFLFKDFDNQREYEAAARYADEVGVMVWKTDAGGMFFASKYEQVKDFLKLRKKGD